MACEITGSKIKEQINNRLELISKATGVNISEGVIIDTRNIENLDEVIEQILKVEYDFGVGSVFKYIGDLQSAFRIKIEVASVKDLEESYPQTANGEQTTIEKNNADKSRYRLISREHLEEQFIEKADKLRTLVFDASTTMEKLFKISTTSEILKDNNIIEVNLKNRLLSIRESLSSATMLDNFDKQVTAFADYLTEVNILTDNINKVVKDVPRDSHYFGIGLILAMNL